MEKRGEKKDDDAEFMPFQGLDKGLVLQEKRIFNETPLNPRKCCQLLTKLLYLVIQGEKFTKTEATDVFFAVTKLFQSKDIPLRRMVFLVLRELAPMSNDVIIIMSSLTKDMNSKIDVYRANAIRTLCGIIDSALLAQVERYLKQAIVDKEPYVSSAALVSGVHLMNTSAEVVKRWVSEVQEALQNKSIMTQYHALGLLHQIKQHDRLAVSKLVSSMTKSSIRSPYAHCLLIRFAVQVMEEDSSAQGERSFYSYLETCLRHKSDIVTYEAARAICNLKNVSAKELTPAITVLQLFLSSPKAALRFAAVRTLNKVAQTHPLSVTTCNLDMENLITDSNRSIATLAITTLLKTGSETSVERLMKQITNFMNEISDEFKIVVVDAIKSLCLKYPQKQRTLMNFLSTILRDEGGFEYKKTIVNTVLLIIKEIPDAKEAGLTHLCEFIEDCEFPYLSSKILNILGKEGPYTSQPSKYIRYIYNRICLESASVRASAISALAKFALKLENLRPSIIVLLKRSLYDNDDEVRSRATFYLRLLEKDQEAASKMIAADFPFPIQNVIQSLIDYKKNPSSSPFSIALVPIKPTDIDVVSKSTAGSAASKKGNQPAGPSPVTVSTSVAAEVASSKTENAQEMYGAMLAGIPQFAKLGNLLRSSKPIELTESETEYVVTCIKHTFPEHFVFQFNCTNTLQEQLLENVYVKMDTSGVKGVKVESVIPLPSLPYGTPGATYICVHRTNVEDYCIGSFSNTLKFKVKEVDPATGEAEDTGVDDEYQVEDLELLLGDYVQRVNVANFNEKWEQLGDEFEVVQTFALGSIKSLQDGIDEITDYLGLQPCERTERASSKNKHILLLAGSFIGKFPCMGRARMKFADGQGLQMELTVRSTNDDISTLIASAI